MMLGLIFGILALASGACWLAGGSTSATRRSASAAFTIGHERRTHRLKLSADNAAYRRTSMSSLSMLVMIAAVLPRVSLVHWSIWSSLSMTLFMSARAWSV